MYTTSIKTAVIIATANRTQLLSERSLPSVVAQTRNPDYLIVCDDSLLEIRANNKLVVSSVDLPGCEIIYCHNHRTVGASGCWNSAIDKLLAVTSEENLFLAFLDDDDEWDSNYIQKCSAAIIQYDLDMVATGFYRVESNATPPLIIMPPDNLSANQFLTTNPGIQGSNLYLSAAAFLEAGCFDEHLLSTTDRDLCIRLADLGTLRYLSLQQPLVYHYAEFGRPRISNAGSKTKLDGLTSFWRKHVGRMNSNQKKAFTDRAKTIFGWAPPVEDENQDVELVGILGQPVDLEFYKLIIGVISSEPKVVTRLLQSLIILDDVSCIKSYKIILLANGADLSLLKETVDLYQKKGICIRLIDEDKQSQDASCGLFGSDFFARPKMQVGISHARTMIQRYLGLELQQNPESIGWMLDDDMWIDERAKSYLTWLPEFRKQGVDVLLGAYEGASPNPPLNGLRVQLLDLVENLRWIESMPQNTLLPDRSMQNKALRMRYPDYYYDLSRQHFGHLEMPFWVEPLSKHYRAADARSFLIEGSTAILNGALLTRNIISSMPVDPLDSAKDSVNRGGCTFILNHAAVIHTPNAITKIHGREARRSDMIWAIVNRYYRGMTIKAVAFPVNHKGRINNKPSLNGEKVEGEIVGSALYAGLTNFLKNNPNHELDFSESEAKEIYDIARRQMIFRMFRLKQSFYRIHGLSKSLGKLRSANQLMELTNHLREDFNLKAFNKIQVNIQDVTEENIVEFLYTLRVSADSYSSAAETVRLG